MDWPVAIGGITNPFVDIKDSDKYPRICVSETVLLRNILSLIVFLNQLHLAQFTAESLLQRKFRVNYFETTVI